MKITLKVEKEFDVVKLAVDAEVRYWEDATVNGVEDEEGDLIPCRDGDYWSPRIDIDTGIITNWEQGKEADIHYKVCDAGSYALIDSNNEVVAIIEGYVPEFLAIEDSGYLDYIKIKVDKNGKINDWKFDPTPFTEEDED